MTQWLLSWLQVYGYWIVLLGAMIEGESVILTASALAAENVLSIYYVALTTFVGTLIADQTIYFLGVYYGPKTLNHLKNRFKFLQPSIEKGLIFLKKNEIIYILTFRFIYGIRIISPFIIGAQHVSFMRFTILNIVAAAVWTILSCSLGFFLGKAFQGLTHHIGLIAAVVLAIIIISIMILAKFRKKKSGKAGKINMMLL